MFNDEELNWYNQKIFSYRDQEYGSESTLDVVISTSSKDKRTFSPLTFNLWIRTERNSTSSNLNIQSAIDLLQVIQEVKKETDNFQKEASTWNGIKIERRYNKNRSLTIKFGTSTSNNTPLAVIQITFNEADFGRVIMPISTFLAIEILLTQHIQNYLTNSFTFPNSMIQRERVASIYREVLKLRSENVNLINSVREPKSEVIMENRTSEQNPENENDNLQNSLDNFVNKNLDNIKADGVEIPQKEEKKEEIYEVSDLISKVFLGKIETLANIHRSAIVSNEPLFSILETFSSELGKPIDTFLPGLKDLDRRSINYLGKLYLNHGIRDNQENGSPLSASTPILKYEKPTVVSTLNRTIAFDLITILTYLRVAKNKLSGVSRNIMNNCEFLVAAMRSFSDPLIFSFITPEDEDVLENVVLKRFKGLKSIGFFEAIDNSIAGFNLSEINRDDIRGEIRMILNKAILGETKTAYEMHKQLFTSNIVKLPHDNDLSLEQIVKVIKLEITEKLGSTVEIPEEEKEIAALFKHGRVKRRKVLKPEQDVPHIIRYMKGKIDQVPVDYQPWFDKVVKGLVKSEFNPECIIDMDHMNDFGIDVLKALATWDPEFTGTYSEWCQNVEESLMTKESILTLWGSNTETSSEIDEWDEIEI